MKAKFSENLREIRSVRGFSQGYVAEKLEITRAGYSSYETGRRTPDITMLERLSEVLGVSVDDLLHWDGSHHDAQLKETAAYRAKTLECTCSEYFSMIDCGEYELIYGQLVKRNAPTYEHQRNTFLLSMAFHNHIQDHNGECKVIPAPFCVVLDEDGGVVVQPDISVVCNTELIKDGMCYGAPDIVVEVVSPSNKKRDYYEKVALYERYGVREYWILDKEAQRVMIYDMENVAMPQIFPFTEIICSNVLKGFAVELAKILEKG